MRQSRAKTIRQEVAIELNRRKLPWKNKYYRTTKKLYTETPRKERHNFLTNLMA